VSGSWEISGRRAIPSISGRSNSGCSWEIESQTAVSGGRAPAISRGGPSSFLKERNGGGAWWGGGSGAW
jgi:hypothetical protein